VPIRDRRNQAGETLCDLHRLGCLGESRALMHAMRDPKTGQRPPRLVEHLARCADDDVSGCLARGCRGPGLVKQKVLPLGRAPRYEDAAAARQEGRAAIV